MTGTIGIKNPQVIDLITCDDESNEYALIMVELRPWEASVARFYQLQEKINHYLQFALEGQLAEMYPLKPGAQFRLQLDCLYPPDEASWEKLALIKDQLGRQGVWFVVNLLDRIGGKGAA